MPIICSVAQCLVWSSLLLQTDSLMWFEEALWAAMFVINSAINVAFHAAGQSSTLISLSLVFGTLYLPWQLGLHLPSIASRGDPPLVGAVSWARVKKGAAKAAFEQRQSKDSGDWGWMVGAVWMSAYWILMPLWMVMIADAYAAEGSASATAQLLATLAA
jgi:hypothetical protein